MSKSLATVICVAVLVAHGAAAQTQTLNLWPGVAPGSENWTLPEGVREYRGNFDTFHVVTNVVTPTLTVYLPEKSKNTGTAVIVAPGGGYQFLVMGKEGHMVAQWLQPKGIAAFVLKYRVAQIPPEQLQLGNVASAVGDTKAQPATPPAAPPARLGSPDAAKFALADGLQALKIVRQHAAEWGISPDRIGFMGFSAGAGLTNGILTQEDASLRPSFAAPIYGGGVTSIPQKLPPVFLAWAQDDTLSARCLEYSAALKAAGVKVEAHIFSSGGHGFGMQKKGTTSDHWIDEFYY